MSKKNKETSGIVSYILFPTDISDVTEIAIEAGSGLCITTIRQKDGFVRLSLGEARRLAEYINAISES